MYVTTRLLHKQYSPMFIVKIGTNLFVGLITDTNAADILDKLSENETVERLLSKLEDETLTIQEIRNIVGAIADTIVKIVNDLGRGTTEGLGVVYVDNDTFVSSLYGDMMTHAMCRQEFYDGIKMMITRDSQWCDYIKDHIPPQCEGCSGSETDECTENQRFIMRKHMLYGWPLWVVVTGNDIDIAFRKLELKLKDLYDKQIEDRTIDDIQNVIDDLVSEIKKWSDEYGIYWYVDKCWIVESTLSHDIEKRVLHLLNVSTGV